MLPYNWREKLSPSAIRDTINANSKVVALIMIVIIVVTLAYVFRSNFSNPTTNFSTKAYFIDDETGEVTVGDKSQHAPLLGKSGKPTVVRLYYFTCTNCNEKQPAYCEKFSDEAKAIFDRPPNTVWNPQDETTVRMGRMIRAPEPGSPWYRVMDREAVAIQERMKCPDNSNLKECDPP